MKNRSIRARNAAPVLSLLSLALSANVQAQTIEVNPVVITGAQIEQPLSQALTAVSVITRQEIERSQAPTLADLLQGEAGFEFGRNGGPGTTTSFFLRGQESINAVVLVDGVRSQVDSIGSLQVMDVPLAQIERIELLRGNASALYGDAAIGGVISITTRNGKGVPAAYGSVSYGSRNSLDMSVGYGGKSEDYRFDFQTGIKKTDGFSAINTEQLPGANSDRDGYSGEYLTARVEKNLTSDATFGIRLQSARSTADTDNAWAGSPLDTHQFKQRNHNLGVFWRQAFSADWVSQLDVSTSSLTYEDMENGQRKSSYGLFEGRQNAVRWFNTWQAGRDSTVNFGADVSDDHFKVDSGSAYEMQRNALGIFAGMTQKLGAFTAQLNLRHDDVKVENQESGSPAGFNRSGADTGLLGLGYTINPSWSVTATVSNGFRAPTASEVSKNPLLKPETHQSAEIGTSYSVDNLLARVVYFDTKTTDAIVYRPLQGWDYTYESVGRVSNRGIEATLRMQWRGHTIKASAVTQDPLNEVTQKPLSRRAKNYGSMDISRPFGMYDVGVRLYASGERTDGANTLSGYTQWAFYASRKLGDNWTARVRLENAFNKQYQLAYGYNTPGRGLFATLQYSPKR
jgi:vitamin B12 transporter